MGNLFDRLERQPPAEEASKEEEFRLIERLLTWLINNWPEPTITARQLRHYGPYPIRHEKKATLDIMRGLEARGWVRSVKPQRHDSREWKIGRPQAGQNGAGVQAG
jgi:hypothetical protein